MENAEKKRQPKQHLENENNEEKFGESEVKLLNLIAEIIVEIILKEEK